MANPNPVQAMPRCTALRTDGVTKCKAPAMANGKCRVHGGASASGLAHYAYKDGRHQRHLGPALQALVIQQLADPDRLSMDTELALIDARVSMLLQRLGPDDGGSTADWSQLAKAMEDFTLAQATKKVALMHEAMLRIQATIERGAGESVAWAEIVQLIDRRRVLVESEERRAVASGRAIPADQVYGMIRRITNIIADEVTDPQVRNRVAERIAGVVNTRRKGLPTTADVAAANALAAPRP